MDPLYISMCWSFLFHPLTTSGAIRDALMKVMESIPMAGKVIRELFPCYVILCFAVVEVQLHRNCGALKSSLFHIMSMLGKNLKKNVHFDMLNLNLGNTT